MAKDTRERLDNIKWKTGVAAKCREYHIPPPGTPQEEEVGGEQWVLWQAQERVWLAERERRDSRLWWIAAISAAASVVSAITALVAVLSQ
jgi:hypothetical protein